MATKNHHFRPGQFLFREGDPSRSLFLIQKGTISVRKRKGTAFIELARIYSNEVIGEMSFFDRSPRSAGAVAITEVEVLEIGFDSLDAIYKKVPAYMKSIMASICERLRKADDTIRKLQKEIITEGVAQGDEGEPQSTAAVLAATADSVITDSSAKKPVVEDDDLAELDRAMEEANVSSDQTEKKKR